MEYIYAFAKTEEELMDFIESFSFSGDDYMLLEKVTDIQFTYYKKTDFHAWQQGRIFNHSYELKWRKTGTDFRIMLITGDDALTGFTGKETIVIQPEEKNIFLWGIEAPSKSSPSYQFKEGEFIETIIPRVLSYPVKNVKKDCRVILKIAQYLNSKGILKYFRFKEVETYEKKSV